MEMKDRFDRVQDSLLKVISPDLNSKDYSSVCKGIEKIRDEFKETRDFAKTLTSSLPSNLVIPTKWLRSNPQPATKTFKFNDTKQVRINDSDVEIGNITKRIQMELRYQKCKFDHEKIVKSILRASSRSSCAEDLIHAIYAVTCPPEDIVTITPEENNNTDLVHILIDFDAYPKGWGLGVSIKVSMMFTVKTSKDKTIARIRAIHTQRWLITKELDEPSGEGIITLILEEEDDKKDEKEKEEEEEEEKEEKTNNLLLEYETLSSSSHNTDTFFVSSRKQWYDSENNKDTQLNVLLRGPLPGRIAQVKSVTCSSRHCIAVSRLGVVFTWGNGSEGALGHGNFGDQFEPRAVEYFLRRDESSKKPIVVVKVSAGSCTDGSHSACISNEGELFMFGLGTASGTGQARDVNIPRLLDESLFGDIDAPASVSCGGGFTMAMTVSGKLFTWGKCSRGRLGQGPPSRIGRGRNRRGKESRGRYSQHLLHPERVRFFTQEMKEKTDLRIKGISSGGLHALALDTNGVVYAWGAGDAGQLGLGSTIDQLRPQEITMLEKKCVDVCCGYMTSAAKDSDGHIYTWGGGGLRSLGHGLPTLSSTDRARLLRESRGLPISGVELSNEDKNMIRQDWTVPRRVEALVGKIVTSMDLGDVMMACVTSSGTMYAWGAVPGNENFIRVPKLYRTNNEFRVRSVVCGGGSNLMYTTNDSELGTDLFNELNKCSAHMRVTGNYGSFDVTVFASGRPFHAHRVVLASRSPEFRRLIEKSWRGATYHTELLLPDISAEVMKTLIEFLYTDNLSEDMIGSETPFLEQLIEVATRFELPRLVFMCEGVSLSLEEKKNSKENFEPTLGSSMLQALEEDGEPFADVRLLSSTSKGRSVMAHRFMLCARSPYFRAVLESSSADMEDEYYSDRGLVVDVTLPDSYAVMLVLMRYMYSGTLRLYAASNNDEVLVGVLLAAQRYEMRSLMEACESAIRCGPSSVLTVLRVARSMRTNRLQSWALHSLAGHLTSLEESSLSQKTLKKMKKYDSPSVALLSRVMRDRWNRQRTLEHLLEAKQPSDEEILLTNYATDFPTRTFLLGMLASGVYTVILSNLEDDYWRYYIPFLNIGSFVLIGLGIVYSWMQPSRSSLTKGKKNEDGKITSEKREEEKNAK